MAIKGLESHYHDNWTAYHALTEAQCEVVIEKAFEILEDIGIKSNPHVCDHFKTIGTVEGDIVKLPREVVIEAIKSTPSHLDIYNRKGEKVIDL
ncbi:MAG TPA: hypothetical protein DCP91_05880, partial [Eggerthellaceae bacterium]|nr:hypothetical protein [Eggerthellaceae bacterium]